MPATPDKNNSAAADFADFGFADVRADEKTALVGDIFSRVAPYYTRMNDLMSGGMHRLWKSAAVARGGLRPGMRVLDLACGDGDIAKRVLPRISPGGVLALADANDKMLAAARRRFSAFAESKNFNDTNNAIQFVHCDADSLPFAECNFHRVFVAFGLRNFARRERALSEIRRVLRPGGMCVILEFTPPEGAFASLQKQYLLSVLPRIGECFFNDAESYRYLGESVLRFPSPRKLAAMMADAGLARAEYAVAGTGLVALHSARRLS